MPVTSGISRCMTVLAVLFPFCSTVRAQTPRDDSSRVYHFPEVTVTAPAEQSRTLESIQPLSLISRAQILSVNASDASDVVACAPGTFVKQYGGLGGLRTVSLRGTSAQQSVLMIDGVRYQSSTEGSMDFSNIPASLIECVEVVRGGDAANYGTNALGGVVNIVTSPQHAPDAIVNSTAGSFGELGLGIGAKTSLGNHILNATFNYTSCTGDYPFQYNEFGNTSLISRGNSDFRNLFGRIAWKHNPDSLWKLHAFVQGFESRRGIPGPVVQGNHGSPTARLNEDDVFAAAQGSYTNGDWFGSLTFSGRLNKILYHDPDGGGVDGTDNSYNRNEFAARLHLRNIISSETSLEFTADGTSSYLDGNNLDPSLTDNPVRNQLGAAFTAMYVPKNGVFGWSMVASIGIRCDYFSDASVPLAPSLGCIVRIAETPLHLRVHAAGSYRVPSFTEKYYYNYGNAGLRPERSVSFDAGLTYSVTPELAATASGFLISTHDQIVSVPRSPVSWSAQNIGATRSRGIEFELGGTIVDNLVDVRMAYTFMRAEDRSGTTADGTLLAYSPEHIGNAVAGLTLGKARVGTTMTFTGNRYWLPMEQQSGTMPAYVLLGANASFRFPLTGFEIILRAEALNILDTQYQVVRNFPMPGRSFRIQLSISYNHNGDPR